MKKRVKIVLSLAIFLVVAAIGCQPVWADFENDDTVITLDETTQEMLSNIDFSSLDEIISELDSPMFKSSTFLEKVQSVLDGETGDIGSYLELIIRVFFSEFSAIVPLLISIVIVAVLCGLILSIRARVGEESVGKLVGFVCYGMVVVLIGASVFSLVKNVTNAVFSIKEQMDIVFPIMLTLLASVGASSSVSVFQPMFAVMSNVVMQIFTYFLLPLFSLAFVFCILSHVSDIKLTKFNSLFSSVFKWSAGTLFSLCLGSAAIGGAMAGSFDSVSIKATRFALKSYIPVLGGYINDGFSLVAASGVLVKNAIGVTGIILAVSVVLYPLISVIILSLGLKFVASIIESIGGGEIASFLSDVSNVLGMLTAILAGVSFLYIANIGILISTANIF